MIRGNGGRRRETGGGWGDFNGSGSHTGSIFGNEIHARLPVSGSRNPNGRETRKIIVPNSKLTGDNITNYSAMELRRVDMVFGIGYGDDIRKAKATLDGIVGGDARSRMCICRASGFFIYSAGSLPCPSPA
ncbi:MAG: mechanosensitive ion channel family protein [Acidobacteria bacterium]|nr:mechanosensitive ion channel family protein [Acidobacteriota bacterium]